MAERIFFGLIANRLMNTNVTSKQLRAFGLTVGGIFALMGLWPVFWQGETPRLGWLAAAGLLMLPALLVPKSLRPVYQVWMAIGHVLGWINMWMILGIIFYGLFTPLGLARRLWGKDTIQCQRQSQDTTYRVVRQPRSADHMRHQF